MAGASGRHITAAGSLYLALRNQLRGMSWRPLPSAMRLRIQAADGVYYPDLVVTCGEVTAYH